MLMRGRCGFSENCLIKSSFVINSGDTPGNFWSKNDGSDDSGSLFKEANVDEGAKSVHVKEWSSEGMAINMKELPGQMCK